MPHNRIPIRYYKNRSAPLVSEREMPLKERCQRWEHTQQLAYNDVKRRICLIYLT
jgi:hypothetical protein